MAAAATPRLIVPLLLNNKRFPSRRRSAGRRFQPRSSSSPGEREHPYVPHSLDSHVRRTLVVLRGCGSKSLATYSGWRPQSVTSRTPPRDLYRVCSARYLSARVRSARCTATRTVPGRLPTKLATSATSSPATTRSITISAWSSGRVATSRHAERVDSSSRASASALRTISPVSGSGCATSGLDARALPRSTARWRAIVNSQALNSPGPPSNRRRSRITCNQVSAATSSGAASPRKLRNRSRDGCSARHSLAKASSSPALAPCSASPSVSGGCCPG